MTDDDDLERRMREGLQRRAEDADTTASVVDLAKRGARRRRGGRVVAGAVALAVAAVAVTGVVIDRSSSPGGDGTPGVANDPTGEPLPTQWRTEYWHDTQVDVPADWGWGGAPDPGYGDGPLACGAVATVSAQGVKLGREDPTLAYVGRPIAQTDLCTTYPDNNPAAGPPEAPYVWLGAAVEPGTVDLGDGYVQETVEVNGSTVTVASQDAALRDRILASATGGETCFSEFESVPDPTQSPGTEGSAGLQADSLTVCAYRKDEGSGSFALTYAAVLGRAQARALVRAADAAPRVVVGCIEQRDWEFVQLRVEGTTSSGAEPLFREYVAGFSCEGFQQAGDTGTIGLTPAIVGSWAVGGIPATVTGIFGDNGELAGYFIGMLG